MAMEKSEYKSDRANHTLISSRGCQCATFGTGNKIITHNGKRHVAWLDSTEEGYFDLVRTLDQKSGEWSPTYTLGRARDDHGRPAMTMDSKGYLHVVFGVHHDEVPYRRSVRPNDASEWTETVTFGADMTYPTFICGPDDTLYLTGRSKWGGVRLFAKPPGKDWEDRGLIIRTLEGCFSYAGYQIGLVWGPDHRTLHLSCSTYQSKTEESNLWGTIQSANYMRSTDFGKSWERADGTPIEIPATSETMDVLAAGESSYPKPGIRNPGAITVDSAGRPFVLYMRYNMPQPGQVFLVTPNERGRWRHLPIQAAIDENWPGTAVIDCRAGFSITDDDVLCMALTIIPRDHPVAEEEQATWGKPYSYAASQYSTNAENARFSLESANVWSMENPKSREIAWLESRDGGGTFTARKVIKPDPEVQHNQPCLERPTGFNRVPAGSYPGLIYFVGECRNAGEKEVIDNDVFWVDVGACRTL